VDALVLERVRDLAEDMLRFAGMELVHLESQRQPGGWVLRLFIDKEGGVTLDDCARISRQLSAQLDVENPIEHPFTLEVSSPGLDRALHSDQDYRKFSGRRIRLTTYAPIAGRRNFQGRLDGLVEGAVVLTLDGGQVVTIPKDQVAKARLELDIE
jgi:ribosome maturation factor RimP